MQQLVSAVSLDVMTEAAIDACSDMGAPAATATRTAWVAWRERHQLAPLRMVLRNVSRARGSSTPSWRRLTDPMRQRVLAEANPEPTCTALGRDLASPGTDASARSPQAAAVARALVALGMAAPPGSPAVMPGQPRGTVLRPSQVAALSKASQRRGDAVYVTGWVQRSGREGDDFALVQRAEAGRRPPGRIALGFDAEPWVGREIVLRSEASSFSGATLFLREAALVPDGSALTPSPLPQAPAVREEVLLQRVTTPPGKGVVDKDIAAIVIHGQSNFSNGTHWEEDVRFLLRDGSVYRRTEMPPDQLNAAASRQLEPQHWGRRQRLRDAGAGRRRPLQPQQFPRQPGPGRHVVQARHALHA
jgi:hypothetical protein